jgi:hypothetical protein
VSGCANNFADCDGTFSNGCEVNTNTSNTHCGDCTTVCTGEPTCQNGSCTGCPNGETACGTSCVDLTSDVSNCGACNYVCPSGYSCSGSTCMAPPCTPTTSGCEYQMASDQVVIEAEHYFTALTVTDSWVVVSDGDASGGQCMFVSPDDGSIWATSPYTDGPRMNYQVNFTSTGTFNLWLRGNEPHGAGDSCYGGVDGAANPTHYDFLDGSPYDNTWQAWIMQTITVNTTGVHTVNIWAREDGLKLDKLVINKSATAPTGTGPAESPLN